MITAELKNIYFNGDIKDKNHAQLIMSASHSFCLNLCLDIGEKGLDGGNYFYTTVVNLNWLINEIKKERGVLEESLIVVDNFEDFNDLEIFIRNKINEISGYTWNDVLKKLRHVFFWEYEEHKIV
ncbi:Imm8 family immunity protein [Conservatibacter flavescens]|uniref:Uncharacterized protein n=1 Tax=Conservatibacter flavescens TaxID=28161 RepID=A0A2M8S481_9PAST|nr:Imm8 family immunity protein [Conservatibacter flavescens]PJG85956.1 hypothetical protein CVP05_03570 [Conservatibacter flavescens]